MSDYSHYSDHDDPGGAGLGRADPRPSGETRDQHVARITQAITSQLTNTALATQGQWSLSWVGLTKHDANLAFIAQGPNDGDGNSVYALVLRGTVMDDLIDQLEDLEVWRLVVFPSAANRPRGCPKSPTAR